MNSMMIEELDYGPIVDNQAGDDAVGIDSEVLGSVLLEPL